jgi:hypothetical protein
MNFKHSFLVLLITGALASNTYADDDDTMMVVEQGATPEDIVKVIELPVFAAASAQEKSASGHEIANQAKTLGKEFGQQIAEDAKNNNISEQVRDDIKQNARRDARGANGRGKGPGG